MHPNLCLRFLVFCFSQRAGERLVVESAAALKIQTAYRRYRAYIYVKALRKDRAAVKLQAGFHGFMSRKKVKQMRWEDR